VRPEGLGKLKHFRDIGLRAYDLPGCRVCKYVAQLVEALCYKPEGRECEFLGCYWIFLFSLPKSPDRPGLVTEMRTRYQGSSGEGGGVLPALKADNLSPVC
jgi:hypothetical protein